MQGIKRRIIQAISYEVILLALFVPIISLVFKKEIATSISLGIILMVIALLWNIIFNFLFEQWEKRQHATHRLIKHRIYHAVGFEGGLMIITVPILAWFLQLGIWQTIVLDIGVTLAIMVYTFIFQWAFDSIFGEPVLLHHEQYKL